MGIAIFEGSSLGKTFGDMQVKVGAFLQSGQWQSFLADIKEGAKWASQLASDLANQGGIKESFMALGELIKASFIEGANAAGDALKKSLGGTGFGKIIGGVSDVLGGIWDFAGKIDQKIGTAEEFYTGKKLGYSSRGVAERERAAKTVAEVLTAIRANAKENRANDPVFKANPWMEGDEGLKMSFLRDQARRAKRNETGNKQEMADAENLALQKEEIDTRKRLNSAIEKQVIAIEENFANYGKQQDEEERRKKAQERYAMLRSEFIDPEKRKDRLKSEALAEQTFTQMQLEEAALRQKFSLYGNNPNFKLNEREQQVLDMIKAREEAGGIGEDYSRETAQNTRQLAEKIDALLKVRTV